MKILVADDSPVLRTAVTRLLEPAGYAVCTAADGVEAITMAYEESPDLILLDVQMPKLTGYMVCRLLKEDPVMAKIPVLILTARDSEEDRYRGVQSGADGYLTKDTLGEGLVGAIRQTLATRALAELSGAREVPEMSVLGETDVLTRVCELLDRKLFEATVVNEITAIGNRAMPLPDSIAAILTDVRRLVRFDAGAVVLPGLRDMYCLIEDEVGAGDLDRLGEFVARKMQTVMGTEIAAEDLRVVPVRTHRSTPEPGAGFEGFYAATLRVHGRPVALLILASRRSGVFNDQVIRTLRTIEPAIASVVESALRFQDNLKREASANLSALSGL